jgi:hypothetical protein
MAEKDNKSEMEKIRRKILDAIEQDQLKEGKKDDFDAELEDTAKTDDSTQFAELDAPSDEPTKTETEPELSGDMAKRFSKSHEVDEKRLRASKKVELSQETDEPSDETPSE